MCVATFTASHSFGSPGAYGQRSLPPPLCFCSPVRGGRPHPLADADSQLKLPTVYPQFISLSTRNARVVPKSFSGLVKPGGPVCSPNPQSANTEVKFRSSDSDEFSHQTQFVAVTVEYAISWHCQVVGCPVGVACRGRGTRDTAGDDCLHRAYPGNLTNRDQRPRLPQLRTTQQPQEYRTPTDQEWEEFLGHFERRRVALGDCGRAYGTSCIHEHSCLRCSLLRPDPAQRPRLLEIRDNLTDRINEARQQRWLGEVEGLKVNLTAANIKLAQLDGLAARRTTAVQLGMPTFTEASGRTITAPTTLTISDNNQ